MSLLIVRLRRWIDANLVQLGFGFLAVGTLLTIFNAVRNALEIPYLSTGSNGASVSAAGLTFNLMSELAAPLVYNSVLFIAVGVLLRSWRVTLVGFEHSQPGDLVVSEPDEDYVVWIGKKYPSALDAELAAKALSHRLTRVGSQSVLPLSSGATPPP